MMSTTAQIKKIYTLLGKHGLRDQKDSIVLSFSAGKTTKVSRMSFNEAAALIGHLVSLDPEENSISKMRNKILAMAHEMNWTKVTGNGVHALDIEHVNNWCISKGYLKKKLDDYTYSELPKLVSQFEEVYKSYLKGV
ncbi:hypothetical protein [Chryseosolibacter indicus]|uniref:DUF1018 domain-containing protein n=1 Tax=Chryseosolibacter indicus TaxID=2782351 RepID=A0ABS5VPI7_9BACT|nr:hypothetical protein [Chryseosolibacter indicus]MBT1702938.1 hypothetical protein [Chryseosolibacter indicus]